MCGIVFAASTQPVEQFINNAHRRQYHRGPDAGNVQLEQVNSVYLGFAHQRLSILDLSERGSQPMASASGKSLIIFNGEIYNYRQLVTKYNLVNLHSGTDTEVALELIEKIGISAASREFNGMWSIIFYDRANNTIHISRDRFGKKPLYYFKNSKGIYFASEMHTLLCHPEAPRTPNPLVAARYLTQSLMNVDNQSWISDILVFPPSSTAKIDLHQLNSGLQDITTYWSVQISDDSMDRRPENVIIEHLRELVEDSVRLRLHADVPVGVALSGGLDSSIISAIAASQHSESGQPVRLFSATNPGSADDESEFALAMAKHLSLDLSQFQLETGHSDNLYTLIKKCIWHNDGPIASFSNVLFYKLMEACKENAVTVVLTGQGADEAFCGYRKYPVLEIRRRLQAGHLLGAAQLGLESLLRGTVLTDFRLAEAKRYLLRSQPTILGEISRRAFAPFSLSQLSSLSDRQWADIAHFSVPYLCHYEDRMSMAWSREVRTPFLDYRIIEQGLRTPSELKLKQGWTKYPLRKAFERDLPASITWRKDKKGFVNPQDSWFRNNLSPQVREVMNNGSALVYSTGLVDKPAYLKLLERYLAGDQRIWFREAFAPFALELWLQEVRPNHAP